MDPGRIRVLIVDDERIARQYTRKILSENPAYQIVGECRNAREALAAITEHAPDLILLDIQMPGIDGLKLIETVGTDKMPATVFITAHDEYAVRAFELYAVGYLLKPFTPDRFWSAVERARQLITSGCQARKLQELLSTSATRSSVEYTSQSGSVTTATDPGSPIEYLVRIIVPHGTRRDVILIEKISWLVSKDSYTEIHQESQTRLLRHSLDWFEARLDPTRFTRIHRSYIVNTALIASIEKTIGGGSRVLLHTGERLPVSRRKQSVLTQLLKSPLRGR